LSELLYLSAEDVAVAMRGLDPVATMRSVLSLHAEGQTILPAEAYLSWEPPGGGSARSLAMPGWIAGRFEAVGAKIINANVENPGRGLPRAAGLTILFDPQTARPLCAMHAASISATRTAAVSTVALQELRSPAGSTAALIGAGTIGRAHLDLIRSHLPELSEIAIYDSDAKRAGRLAEENGSAARLSPAGSAEEAVRSASVIVTTTTVTSGYIPYEWLAPGAVLAHVSLDDALPDVVEKADLVLVDDWELVREDSRRLLGRLYCAGKLRGPGEDATGGQGDGEGGARAVDASIGDVLIGAHPGRRSEDEIVLVNPFGMAIADIALAKEVYDGARRAGLGVSLPFE
jgi:N-[(2S)-2-amino-2-carboxyethyl]-L-glutamate dehydrogenase